MAKKVAHIGTNQPSFFEVFNASQETKTVDILIYGSIPNFDWDTYELKNDAEKFVREFKNLEKDYDRINIHINSPGGSIYHSIPIFNAIKASTKEVHTYNDGLAASAAGVLLLAGKKIHSAKNAMLMIHRASGIAMGTAEKMRDTADMLEKYEGVLAQHFADISGKSKEDIISSYFNGKDHFLTAEEALAEGFIHSIESYESEDAPPENIKNMAFSEVMNLYRPQERSESFLQKITNHIRSTFNLGAATQTPAPDPAPTITHTDMNFDKSIQLLDKATLTAEDIAAIKAEITAYRTAGEKFTPDEVQNKVAEATAPLTAEITALSTEKANVEALAASLTQEKTTLETAKNTLESTVSSQNVIIESYRKSGVRPDLGGQGTPDPIPGADTPDNFYSETDAAVRKMRQEMGLTDAK
jgi:ATP-dependent Clp protease, protease subunit